MTTMHWLALLPTPLLVVVVVAVIRWVVVLHRRVDDHTERIAHIEGRLMITEGEDE